MRPPAYGRAMIASRAGPKGMVKLIVAHPLS